MRPTKYFCEQCGRNISCHLVLGITPACLPLTGKGGPAPRPSERARPTPRPRAVGSGGGVEMEGDGEGSPVGQASENLFSAPPRGEVVKGAGSRSAAATRVGFCPCQAQLSKAWLICVTTMVQPTGLLPLPAANRLFTCWILAVLEFRNLLRALRWKYSAV